MFNGDNSNQTEINKKIESNDFGKDNTKDTTKDKFKESSLEDKDNLLNGKNPENIKSNEIPIIEQKESKTNE